jgi:hypothetical protein
MLLGPHTHTYLDLENPNRQNLFTTANVSQDFRGFTANLGETYSNTTGSGSSTESKGTSAYITTTDRKLFGSNSSGVRMTTNITVTDSSVSETYNGQTGSTKFDSDGLGIRLFTPALNLGKYTSMTDSYNLNDTYDQTEKKSAVNMGAALGLSQKLGRTTMSSLSYNWTYNPLNQSLEIVGSRLVVLNVPDLHRFGLAVVSNSADSKWDLLMNGDFTVPTGDYDASTGLNLHFNPSWSFGVNNMYNRTDGLWFRDIGVTLGLRLGQRNATFSYSLDDHHIRFNLDTARF